MDKAKSGTYLREKRLALGLSESEIAEKLGVSAYDVTCWEMGFFPEVQHLLPLSQALGVSVDEILKGEDERSGASLAPRVSCEITPAPSSGQGSPAAQASPEALANLSAPAPGKAESKGEPPTPSDTMPPTPSPPPRREEKSYYEKLHEKMKDIDFDAETYPSGQNGFSARERRFGYILCSVFIAVLLLIRLSGLIGYINRERELTIENYREYVGISVKSISSFNPQEYDVAVTAKKRITNFQMTVEVFFHNLLSGMPGKESENFYKTVSFSAAVIESGTTVTQRITLEKIMFERGTTVISVSGGLG